MLARHILAPGARGAWFYTSAPLTPVLVDILCSVHCYHCYCCCLLCCYCTAVLNLSLSQTGTLYFTAFVGEGQRPRGLRPRQGLNHYTLDFSRGILPKSYLFCHSREKGKTNSLFKQLVYNGRDTVIRYMVIQDVIAYL